jgi:aryl-alcohol dehydrogenase-like predicted oxidoreductase
MQNNSGQLPFAGTHVNRIGYGAMQLAGPGVWGPPRNHEEAVAVLREAIALGVNHIDTSDFYGPHTVNQLIREALHPYPEDLIIVTKVGARRTPDRAWLPALSPAEITSAIHDNLRNLGLESLDVVNLRVGGISGPLEKSLAEAFGVLAQLREQGLIRHLGLSNITSGQLREAQSIAPVVCVQNHYNVVHRADDALVDTCAAEGIAFVPYFPLGGFSPIQSGVLESSAARLGATPMQIALAWLLQRSGNILLIPGTSSVRHLRENLAAASLDLPPDAVAELDGIGGVSP